MKRIWIAVAAGVIAGGGVYLAVMGTRSPSSVEVEAHDAPVIKRGQIVKATSSELGIRLANGSLEQVHLDAKMAVMAVSATELDKVRSGSYVGAAAAPDGKGDLKAIEVHIFDERLRGLGEGHSILDPVKKNSMTNGTVGSVVAASGRTITVRYGKEQKQIHVAADVPVTLIAPGDRNLLTPGNRIVAIGKQEPGKFVALQLLVGLDGFKPPL